MRVFGSSRRAAVLVAIVAISLVAASAATGLSAIAGAQQPSGDDILDDVEERYDEAETVTGTAEVTMSNDSETTEATVDFVTKAPDKFSLTVAKDDGTTYEAGSNGSVAWAVGEEESVARELPSDGEQPHEKMTEPVGENVDAELVETTELNGEEAYVVELTPTEEADEKYEDVEATVWVSTDDSRVLQVTASDDTTETTVEVTETQFDVSVHDSTFEPPEDRVAVTTTETYDSVDSLEESTDLAVPSYDDGEFEAATQLTSADGEAVIQTYTTDDGEVEIITAVGAEDRLDDVENGESVTVDGEDATAVERDDRSIVFWTDDEVTTGVVVDGSVDDALTVAEEIR